MAAESVVVTTVQGTEHRVVVQVAYHRSFPEIRVEADSQEAALERLTERLARDLDFVSDEFHRGAIRRALADVDRARTGH